MNNPSEHFGIMAVKGYKQPLELVEKRRQTLLAKGRKLKAFCANCGKDLIRANERIKKGNCYCDGKCQMDYEYKNGIRDKHKITMKAHDVMHNLIDKGEWSLQKSENIIKAHKACGSKNYGGTWIEKKMKWALTQLGIQFESQYPIKYGLDTSGRARYYFPDFALVDNRILVECDGKQYHKDRDRDKLRQSRLENLGWRVLRFPGDEIKRNVMACAHKIQSVLPVV